MMRLAALVACLLVASPALAAFGTDADSCRAGASYGKPPGLYFDGFHVVGWEWACADVGGPQWYCEHSDGTPWTQAISVTIDGGRATIVGEDGHEYRLQPCGGADG